MVLPIKNIVVGVSLRWRALYGFTMDMLSMVNCWYKIQNVEHVFTSLDSLFL